MDVEKRKPKKKEAPASVKELGVRTAKAESLKRREAAAEVASQKARKRKEAAAVTASVREQGARLGSAAGLGTATDQGANRAALEAMRAKYGQLPDPGHDPKRFRMKQATFNPEVAPKDADELTGLFGNLGLGPGGGGAARPSYVSPWLEKLPKANGGRKRTRKQRKFRIPRNPTRKNRR